MSPSSAVTVNLPPNGGNRVGIPYADGLLLCGGCAGEICDANSATKVCNLILIDSQPIPMPSMLEPRDGAAGTLYMDQPWVTGGKSSLTTEYLDKSGHWNYGPTLPHELTLHCMVALDDNGTIHMAIGGLSTIVEDRTYIYDWNNPVLGWVYSGNLVDPRAATACTKIKFANGKEKVLVAGGRHRPNLDIVLFTVDIFDIGTRTW